MQGTASQSNKPAPNTTGGQPQNQQPQQPQNDIYANANTGGGNYNNQPGGAPVGGAQRQGSGIAGLFSRNRFAMATQTGGRDLSELTTKFQEFFEKEKNNMFAGMDIRISAAPRQSIITSEQKTNSIGMLLVIMGNGNGKFAHHALLMASDMGPAPSRNNEMYGNYGQEQIAPPRTPATVADDALAGVISQRVGELIQQGETFSADWSTVPTDFRLNDDVAVQRLFLNAAHACYIELQTKTPDFVYESLSSVAGDGLLVNAVHFNQDQTNPPFDATDPAGNPIRSEIVTAFRSEQPRQQARDGGTENTSGVMELGNTLACVSLVIDPVPARANRHGGYLSPENEGQATQEYSAEVIVTGFDMSLPPDLGNVLLQLSTILAAVASQERPWLRSFYPRHLQHNGGTNLRNENFRPRDLGALNFDYGLATPVANDPTRSEIVPFPTNKPNEFTLDTFYWLANKIIQQAPALGIDCPIAGAETWFTRIFAESSEVADAKMAIVKAMDALTDNVFSQKFFVQGADTSIVSNRVERILNGHFPGPDGRPVDVRVADMLYLMNAKGHEDPLIGRRYAATFGGSNDAQLAARAKIIESAVHNVTWTGVSLRKYFMPHFLRCVNDSIELTGLKPRIDIAQTDNTMQMRTPYGLAQAGVLLNGFNPSMFQSGPMYSGPQSGYRGMSHNRTY